MKAKEKRVHFEHFSIAGFTYYDGALVFDRIRVGTDLELVPEPENAYDRYAVALYLEGSKLGFVPRGCNREMSKILNAGHSIFRAVVQRVDPTKTPEDQVGVIVFLKSKEE